MKLFLSFLSVFSFLTFTIAEETISEKVQVKTKDARRGANKAYHRVQESLCGKLNGDSKAECLAQEAKNRLKEGADAVGDKASEIKNKVDSDKK